MSEGSQSFTFRENVGRGFFLCSTPGNRVYTAHGLNTNKTERDTAILLMALTISENAQDRQ